MIRRLFQRQEWKGGIQGKLTWLLVLLSTVPLLLIGGYLIRTQMGLLQAEQLRTVKAEVIELKERVALYLSGIARDVRFLGNTAEVRQMLDDLTRLEQPAPVSVQAAQTEFMNLLESNASYIKLAFLDRHGNEVFAVFQDPETKSLRAEVPLVAKRHFYYVYAAEGMKAGETKFSPCEIQRPQFGVAPAIDCILPLLNHQGELVGILVGSIHAEKLFELLNARELHSGRLLIANAEGHYLYHSEKKKDWNMLLASRDAENLLHDYPPAVARQILSTASGTITEGGERIIEHSSIFSGDGRQPIGYMLIRDLPTSAVLAAIRPMRFALVVGLLGVAALSVLCARWLARRFLLPITQLIAGTNIIRGGNLDYKLEIDSRDELQELVRNFNLMVAHWKETRRLEEKVKRSEELYSTIVETAHDMIWTLDLEGNFTFINQRGAEICGCKSSEWIGRKFTLLVAPQDLPKVQWVLHQTLAGNPQSFDLRLQNERGRCFTFFVNAVALRAGNAVAGSVYFGRDVTESKHLKELIQQSQKLETVGRLAGHIVHEINNPIGVISAKAKLLLSDHGRGMPGKVSVDLGKISLLADRAARICQGLLSYCRPSSEAERVEVDVRVPVRQALAAVGSAAQSRGIEMQDALSEPMLLIKGNPAELEQVFVQLFVNAIDAMPQGGRLRVSNDEEPVLLEQGSLALAVRVEDTGTGIPLELHGRIFEPFFTSKDTGQGSGLGLAVCQGFVRSHGGEIEVQSQVGQGSCFTVKLPLDTPMRKSTL